MISRKLCNPVMWSQVRMLSATQTLAAHSMARPVAMSAFPAQALVNFQVRDFAKRRKKTAKKMREQD